MRNYTFLLAIILIFLMISCAEKKQANIYAEKQANVMKPKKIIKTDSLTGLKMVGDWEIVRNNCIACHSPMLITQNSGSRETWKDVIRWMQKTQNLWKFDPTTENKILNYLSINYGQKVGNRRPPLAKHLLPKNPYKNKHIKK